MGRPPCSGSPAPLREGADELLATFWRDGDGFNVAINDGRWFDHVSNTGGGALTLIEMVLGCDRRAALDWLSVHFGIERGQASPEERRAYAQNIDRARDAAAALVRRRDELMGNLWERADLLFVDYHRLSAIAYQREDIEVLADARDVWRAFQSVTDRRDALKEARGPDLAQMLAGSEREAA